jgi:hypothetical protein
MVLQMSKLGEFSSSFLARLQARLSILSTEVEAQADNFAPQGKSSIGSKNAMSREKTGMFGEVTPST